MQIYMCETQITAQSGSHVQIFKNHFSFRHIRTSDLLSIIMGCSASKDGQDPSVDNATYLSHDFNVRWDLDLSEKNKLGEGGFSDVYRVKSKRDGSEYAVKIMEKAGMHKDDVESVYEEVRIMKLLQHPNIVKFIDFFDEGGKMYVVLEFLQGGALFDRVVERSKYSEGDARDLIYIFLTTLKFCHDHDIVHRDIKPENLLLASESNDFDVKIADFGLSAHVPKGKTLQQVCGTPQYLAPEMLGKNVAYSKPVDMWAVGCIAFILLGGYQPFDDPNDNLKEIYNQIRKGKFEFKYGFKRVSNEAKELIRALLTVNPQERMTVEQALAHPWVTRAKSELAARNLEESLVSFQKFFGKRKFKGAVKGIIAANRMKKLLGGARSAAAEDAKTGTDTSAKTGETSEKEISVELTEP